MIPSVTIEVSVSPRSSRRGVKMDDKGGIKIYINSPPVDGKANVECIKLLSKTLGIAKSMIAIERGENVRKKIIRVSGLTREELMDRMQRAGFEK